MNTDRTQDSKPADPAPQAADAESATSLTRRGFLRTGVAAGAGSALAGQVLTARAQTGKGGADELNLALVGFGLQGRALLNACSGVPGLHFRAVCDIWERNRTAGQRWLQKSYKDKPVPNAYEDYRIMLEKEKDLDGVIVAVPDVWHSPITCAALQAGVNVYCEKLMSNTLEGARKMVRAAMETGKLLQIGHQRRSNVRYQNLLNKLIRERNLFGWITHAYGQWNRAVSEDFTWPKKSEMSPEQLAKWGYKDMREFRNWRWFKEYGGGPISDLGAHQIDIFLWFFGGPPKSVIASGGIDFYKQNEHYDNAMAIYEFDTPEGVSRAFYQVLTTTSAKGFYESFMGTDGTVNISEDPKVNQAYQEARIKKDPNVDPWADIVEKGWIKKKAAGGAEFRPWERPHPTPPVKYKKDNAGGTKVDSRGSAELEAYQMQWDLGGKYAHQPHLENFFSAIREGTPLNCPSELAYQSSVAVLTVNDAIREGRRIDFKPEDFLVPDKPEPEPEPEPEPPIDVKPPAEETPEPAPEPAPAPALEPPAPAPPE